MTASSDNQTLRLSFPVAGADFLAAGEAAAKIKKVLQQIGLEPDTIRRVAIVSYEAEMNIVIHASGGTVTACISPESVCIVADDTGPGIPDIDLAMQEGFSTAPDEIREMGFGAGMGLPNIKRNSDSLAIDTTVGVGTTVRATINTAKR